MVALGVVVALCAVAMIGAAYAAFAGNARTYNENNAVTAGSMVLSPNGQTAWVAFTGASALDLEFESYTYNDSGTKTAYYKTGGTPIDDYTAFVLGSAKDFIVTNNTLEAIGSFDLIVTPTAAVGNADFVYIMGVNDGTNDYYEVLDNDASDGIDALEFNITATIAQAAGSTLNLEVTLYIAYEADVYIPDSFIGPALSESARATACNVDNEHPYNAATMNYDQAAKQSNDGPDGFADLDFGFCVTNTAAPTP